ncbi:MAG: GlsB/YeaQ/YmgE family stress response membrane protein [Bryobacteraceae bacterium]|jgi:uncharacterized membrane protein YeaQ/YmgE (transglycosylase-associated protein family)
MRDRSLDFRFWIFRQGDNRALLGRRRLPKEKMQLAGSTDGGWVYTVQNGFRLKASVGGKRMFHMIWYILIGLISGVIAKSAMHVHITIFWTIVLGIIGSIIGGGVTHMFSRPTNERYHPAGLIFSTLGAILVLFICYKLKIHFPQVNPF